MSKPTTVGDVMTPDPIYVGPSVTLEEAYGLMTSKGFRHLPVVEEGQLIGILSTTDIGKLAANVPELMKGTVGSLMTPNPMTISPTERIDVAAARMAVKKINCLPVIEAGEVVGIVTTYDLLDAMARRFRAEEGVPSQSSFPAAPPPPPPSRPRT